MQSKINKEDWVAMFRDAGLSDDAMIEWHHLFETRHPDAHAEFLTWLGLSTDEIANIRTRSR